MKNIKNFVCRVIGVYMLTAFTSCSLNIPPPDEYADPDAIKDGKTARAYITDTYINYPHNQYELSILGNDLCPTKLAGNDQNSLFLYYWKPKEIKTLASGMWLAYYNTIANCDALLERVSKITSSSEEENAMVKTINSEAKMIKAMAYFDLLQLFAPRYSQNEDKPGVILKSIFGIEYKKRSSIAECLDYIERLTNEAKEVSKKNETSLGWLNDDALTLLKARIALYKEDYKAAARLSEVLIANVRGKVSEANLTNQWTEGGDLLIFGFNERRTYYTGIQYDEKMGDYFALNPELSIGEDDKRRDSYLYDMDIQGKMWTLIGKYNLMNKKGKTTNYVDAYRYAEAFFIAAEAYARLGDDEKARDIVNSYLISVGAREIEDIKAALLIERILDEKFKEMAGEGRNFYDMKRAYRERPVLDPISSMVKSTIKNDDYRWTLPIPRSEWLYNDEAIQNDEWYVNNDR